MKKSIQRSGLNLAGGLAGALALNIIHQTAAGLTKAAPRVDKVGEEALSKTMESVGAEPPKGKQLFIETLAADILANTFYYSFIGQGSRKNIVKRGAGFGLLAGLGALTLTDELGLDDTPITKSTATKMMTVAWYVAGGLITALTIRAMKK